MTGKLWSCVRPIFLLSICIIASPIKIMSPVIRQVQKTPAPLVIEGYIFRLFRKSGILLLCPVLTLFHSRLYRDDTL